MISEKKSQPITFRASDSLYRAAHKLARKIDPEEARVSVVMRRALQEFIDKEEAKEKAQENTIE